VSGGTRVHVAGWSDAGALSRLADHDALVLTTSLHASAAEMDSALATLSPNERERHATYTNSVVARRFVIGRARLRAVLARLLGVGAGSVGLRQGLHGKPVLPRGLAARPLWFSVAHCEDLLLVALSRKFEVGVDVERVRSIEHWERMAERVLDPAERAQLRQAVKAGADPGTAFLRHWCRVEAELKAIGCGIAGLDAHLAGRRPLGLRLTDLGDLPLPAGLAGGVPYLAAVALCSPGVDSARQTTVATLHDAKPAIAPASTSTA
jgi:4'-phosphopantetheinyl transferase